MISNTSKSKNAPAGEFVDVRKYKGVASVSILAVNPDNNKLRSYGWIIPEGADEPKYMVVDPEGRKSFRVRLLVQIHDLDDKPVVAMDFWTRPDVMFNKDQTKCKIIDAYGRTAYGTKAEVQGHMIPTYTNGLANISADYKPCHSGEEEIVNFLIKFLNVTPYRVFDRKKNAWVLTDDPGRVTIDDWKRLANGDLIEIKKAISMEPENRVKVIFGVRTTEDNKSYQTFLSTAFIGNGAIPSKDTGEYSTARKAIDKWQEAHPNLNIEFSAMPVKEWNVSATEVKEEAVEDMPDFSSPEYTRTDIEDLPFADI